MGKISFHEALTEGTAHGGKGLAYNKLYPDKKAWLDLRLEERRALASFGVSRDFWEVFERMKEDFQPEKRASIDYDLILVEVEIFLSQVLKKTRDSVQEIKDNCIKQLESILEEGEAKGRVKTAEAHILGEIMGALTVIASMCELVETLYERQFHTPIPEEVFKGVLRSKTFLSIADRIAGMSQAVAATFLFNVIALQKSRGPVDRWVINPEFFELKQDPDWGLKIGKNLMKSALHNVDGHSGPHSEVKLRCPAQDISVTNGAEKKMTMVRAMTEWFIEKCILI